MKKIIKNNIFGFIIGVLITSGISIGAISMYSANQVSYQKADNTEIDVNNALDDLYGEVNQFAEVKNTLNEKNTELTNTKTELTSTKAELAAAKAELENASGVPSAVAKDASGNDASVNYYGARVANVTKTFTMNKGKYLLNIYSTFTQSYYGGDSTSTAVVSGGNITKINNYCYIVEITDDSTIVSIKFNSGGYGNSGDSRTMYAITFLQ